MLGGCLRLCLGRLRGLGDALILGTGHWNEALNVFRANQVGEKDHELERVGKRGVAPFDSFLDLGAQGLDFLDGEIDDPTGGALMLRPGLNLRIAVAVERRIPDVQLKAFEPFSQ